MSNFYYVQQLGGKTDWKAIPASMREVYLRENMPEFITVLSVNKLVEELGADDKLKLSYEGPLYFDFDAPNIGTTLPQVNKFLDKLEELQLDLTSIRCYATGGKGFHIEIPQQCFMDKMPKQGVMYLPVIYREIAMELCVDTLDLRVYSQKRGRMWRVPNNLRPNGTHKVAVTAQDIRSMTVESYAAAVSAPRGTIPVTPPHLCIDLAILYSGAVQKVDDRMKAQSKFKRQPNDKLKAKSISIEMMMDGRGIKEGTGFHELALQIAIAASTSGMTEAEMLTACQGLIENHVGDGGRYGSQEKRRLELSRMFAYCDDNPCYGFSVGAVKSLLSHAAPDLDGLVVSEADITEGIAEAKEHDDAVAAGEVAPDEFADTSGGVTLSKFGVYIDTEFGKKRICAISFKEIHLLVSTETGQLSAYEAQVLVNGRETGRQTMELDTFSSVQMFNRFAARLGHALQGVETHIRGLMMRFVELAKKKGRMRYIAKREGLDLVNIPNHENLELRKPFMVWADTRGVILDPRLEPGAVDMSYQGFPEPHGLFRSDLADAPALQQWLSEDPANVIEMTKTLDDLFSCQRPEVIGKLLGWYTSSIYRMIFHKAYGQFPVLHINGSAGAGKSLRRGTPVIMASGAVKKIEDVVVGDQLLGPDGTARNVLELGRGREDMWEVKPVKGDPYYVNGSHILSLKRSYGSASCKLSDGTVVPADQQILNVNLRVFAASSNATQKQFKGYRPEAVEFVGEQEELPLDPYWLGCWLGDGSSAGPTLSKGACNMTDWWVQHAKSLGCFVSKKPTQSANCFAWAVTGTDAKAAKQGSWSNTQNIFTKALRGLSLIGNKHIPQNYKVASVADRLKLIAGLIDSDGSVSRGGFDWVSKDQKMAEDFTWLCRSVGLAAYMRPCRKGIKRLNFMGIYYRVSVSGDCERVPCLDKKAPPRKQIKDHLVTGLSFKELGVEDYYGVVLDGDRLFLLGDFTVTHNSAMSKSLMALFFYNQEAPVLTPGSTLFSVQQHMSASASIPLVLDEYKPQDMSPDMHAKYRLLIRDAYNCRTIAKGGGTRESDDYRSLHQTALAAPLVVIAEAAEEEAAVSERVVLVTFVKPASSMSNTWAQRYHRWARNGKHLSILGQWLVGQAIKTSSLDALRAEFDPLYLAARNKYLLNAGDETKGLTNEVMMSKQNAKERSVFNFTVARFGLMKFRGLVETVCGDVRFKAKFDEMEAGIYERMSDLQGSTQAEWAKVLNTMSTMSYEDPDQATTLRNKKDYAFIDVGGLDCIEISMRSVYLKYRSFCRLNNSKALFAGDQSFLQAIRDCPAFVGMKPGTVIEAPNAYIFRSDALVSLGVEIFKGV